MKYWFYKPHGIVMEVGERPNWCYEDRWGVRCVVFTNPSHGKPYQVGMFMTGTNSATYGGLINSLKNSSDFVELPHFEIIYRRSDIGSVVRMFLGIEHVSGLKYQWFDILNYDKSVNWITILSNGGSDGESWYDITEEEFNMELDKIRMERELLK